MPRPVRLEVQLSSASRVLLRGEEQPKDLGRVQASKMGLLGALLKWFQDRVDVEHHRGGYEAGCGSGEGLARLEARRGRGARGLGGRPALETALRPPRGALSGDERRGGAPGAKGLEQHSGGTRRHT